MPERLPDETTPPANRRILCAVVAIALVAATAGSGEETDVRIGPATADANGCLVHTVTSPYQTGTTKIRVLLPDREPPGRRCSVLYVLPVEAREGTRWGDGLLEVRKAGLHNRHGLVCVAPSFSHLPWYADHPTDSRIRQETFFLEVVVPFVEKTYAVRAERSGRLLLGFSKSGWGAFSLLLRHPDRFGRAAAWDAPLTMTRPDKYGTGPIFGTLENFKKYQITSLLEERASHLRSRERLVLLGYGNFRSHHRSVHGQLGELGIPHAYRDGPERTHHWASGWLEEAVSLVAASGVRKTIGGVHVSRILAKLGAKGREGATEDQLRSYRRVFSFLDADADGHLSWKEFVEDGRYLDPPARAGIFRASDRDRDGAVSRDEYVENRGITDEAKAVFSKLDATGDGRVHREEFLERSRLAPRELALAVFDALDADADGSLNVPEYLRVWGDWARVKTNILKVFVLAGQSNMEGQAVVDLDHEKYYNGGRGTLERLMKDPAKAHLFRHLKNSKGEWVTRDDVSVWYRTGRGEIKSGNLSIGYGVYPGRHHFGPELQFGHVIGDLLEEPVLLIKTAWGGKSLYRDFRPPSSRGEVGPCYLKMLAEIRGVLGSLDSHFPRYAGWSYDIAGFVWFQGWNDMFDKSAVDEYEENLANLIQDFRKEIEKPSLPVVIGETGNSRNMAFRAAQAAVARRPELAGTVTFVPTAPFLRPAKESPNVGHGHHWFGNAESYFLIGEALGQAMKKLLPTSSRGAGGRE